MAEMSRLLDFGAYQCFRHFLTTPDVIQEHSSLEIQVGAESTYLHHLRSHCSSGLFLLGSIHLLTDHDCLL